MHFSNLVLIEPPEDGEPIDVDFVTAAVQQAMGPHEEHGGFWDWYQIGGRWSGTLDGYDPEADPKNAEPCKFCENGITTQAIADTYPAYQEHVGKTCIQCKGQGARASWPTQWGFHQGDVQPVTALTDEQYGNFYRLVLPSGCHYESERYEPWQDAIEARFVKVDLPPLEWLKREYASCLAVVVDNHC